MRMAQSSCLVTGSPRLRCPACGMPLREGDPCLDADCPANVAPSRFQVCESERVPLGRFARAAALRQAMLPCAPKVVVRSAPGWDDAEPPPTLR